MTFSLDDVVVENNAQAGRFEARVEGYLTVIDYIIRGETIIFTHTGVPVPVEGRGIGTKMAHTALEYARAQQLKVVPSCPFVAAYIRDHPEYQPLVRK